MRFRAGLPLRAKGCATSTTEQRPSVDFSRTEELEFLLRREVLGEERRNRGNGSSPCFDAGKKVGIGSEIGARASSSISARKARPFVTFYRLEGSRQTRPKSIIRSLVGNSE
ncbi:hypothetical protein K0M31_003176 [Melipona bicolor]|uniref:Uncharacterized protein n=1 Tax=Melipona bicolor TaxID=60889 RepID=A0AA40FZD1_9HYME|nr:hypothetical protein K0M31_003176 [Melipona bicolor]